MPPEMFMHLCFPLLAALFSSKGRVDVLPPPPPHLRSIKAAASVSALLEKFAGNIGPTVFSSRGIHFVISARNCARSVTRNVRISGSDAGGFGLMQPHSEHIFGTQ